LGRKKIYDQALFLIDHEQPGMFNQAIMEFGALQCKPVNPECGECLLKKKCTAFLEGKVKQLPVKNKPKKQKIRYFNYFVIIRKKEKGKKFIFLRKREENDVWKNLYDFPMVETATEISDEILFSHPEWKRIINESQFRLIFTSNQYKHILTHQVIFAKFFIIHINGRHKPGSAYLPVPVDDFKKYPVPRLIEEFFNQNRVSF
jgi:A/G-specific adenine glycosylase